jgi:hypothetical protein
MSQNDSPCSVPSWLRAWLPVETPEQQEACSYHDEAYSEGGGRRQRLLADLILAIDLLHADMEPDLVEKYFWGVRMYGSGHWTGGDAPGVFAPPAPKPEAP